MRTLLLAAGAATMALTGACTSYGSGPGYYGPSRSSSSWDAARHYRSGDRYRERRLGRDDTIYRGSDGRYYCRRDDGTTGLVVGALAGGVLGNIIAPGGSKVLGTLIGAGAGAAIGAAVDKGEAVCR